MGRKRTDGRQIVLDEGLGSQSVEPLYPQLIYFQRSAELNAMNLCKALSKEPLWDSEGLELENQEIRIQDGLASVCRQLRTSPSIFPQFTAARTVCLNASARRLLRRVTFFPS